MQIFPDNRSIAHFGNQEEGLYTLIFPSTHTLKQRYEAIQFLSIEVAAGIKAEELKAQEEAKKAAEAPAEEIKENSVVEEKEAIPE